MIASLFVLLIYLNWAATKREVLGFGENFPTYGYFFLTDEGKFFLIDIYSKLETQLLFAHGKGAWSALWRPIFEITSSQGYHATGFDLPPFGWDENANDKTILAHGRPNGSLRLQRSLAQGLYLWRIHSELGKWQKQL